MLISKYLRGLQSKVQVHGAVVAAAATKRLMGTMLSLNMMMAIAKAIMKYVFLKSGVSCINDSHGLFSGD